MENRREDIPGWDSFNYINFIVAVEAQFGVKFKIADIELIPRRRRDCHAGNEDVGDKPACSKTSLGEDN